MANAKPQTGANKKSARKYDPNVPKKMTMVRCPECGVKRCVQLKADCECGGKKKAGKKAAPKAAPEKTPETPKED